VLVIHLRRDPTDTHPQQVVERALLKLGAEKAGDETDEAGFNK
jgi:hypothetical protein